MAILKARVRTESGKGAARKLRAAGEIPAVAYGHGEKSRSLALNAHELELLLATINPETTIIDLQVPGGKPAKALIREVQHHPSRPFILHVDFFQIKAGEKLHIEVPIRLHGSPKGVREEGGLLQEVLRELTVECFPEDIPSSIDLDVGELGLGDSIHVSDVTVDKGTILNDGELVICTVAAPSTAALSEAEEAAADAAEPERAGGSDGAAGEG